MTRAVKITILFAAIALTPSLARAQDLGNTNAGASTRAPEEIRPAELLKEVQILPDKTKKGEDYLIPCGQGCAFEAGQEAMAVLGFYFQNKKISTQDVKKAEYIENVKKCTANDADCRTDPKRQQMFLESSLHYQFGKEIRAAYLENTTNRENIRSLGVDPDAEQRESVESLDYKWFQGESTWKTIQGKIDARNQEYRERDNFQFDLNQIGDRETEVKKLKELDPEFVRQYQAYFNSFSQFNDRAFVKARQLERKGRALASRDGQDSGEDPVFVLNTKKNPIDAKNTLELHEGIKRDVNRGTTFGILEDASKRANAPPNARDFKDIANLPEIFKGDEAHFDFRRQVINEALGALPEVLKKMKDDPNGEGEKIRNTLSQVGLTVADLRNPTEASFRKALTEAGKDNDKKEQDGKSSLQMATDVNRQIEQLVESRKNATDADKKSISVTLNLESFDNFLEKIWPTDEGEKYRVQLQEQVKKRKGTKIAIEEMQ